MRDLHIPLIEKLKSIPETFGIRLNEEPPFEVLMSDRNFEVRHYHDQLIAKITIRGVSFDDFREIAFNRLAHYIFDDRAREQVAMTSPVLEQQNSMGSWTMSFILPSDYRLATAPKPRDPQIFLEEVESYDAAVVTYSGNNTFEKMEFNKSCLDKWLETHPRFMKQSEYIAAQYDAPFVIPFFKKNEVMVKVKRFH